MSGCECLKIWEPGHANVNQFTATTQEMFTQLLPLGFSIEWIIPINKSVPIIGTFDGQFLFCETGSQDTVQLCFMAYS